MPVAIDTKTPTGSGRHQRIVKLDEPATGTASVHHEPPAGIFRGGRIRWYQPCRLGRISYNSHAFDSTTARINIAFTSRTVGSRVSVQNRAGSYQTSIAEIEAMPK